MSIERMFLRPIRRVWTAENKRTRLVLLIPILGLLLGLVMGWLLFHGSIDK
ncbi:MAG: hypothetical protein ABI286_04885 [Edaphobacter sp.]